jgi:uncharacterized cupin superfamily protein
MPDEGQRARRDRRSDPCGRRKERFALSHLAHWDDVAGKRQAAGHIAGTWRDLGAAAGSVGVGLQRIEIDSERWSTPAHVEGAEEEIFYVLGGTGLSWQDGETYAVGPGDCLVHLVGERVHTLRADAGGLDVLAFGQRASHGNTHLPRAGISWMWPAFVEATTISRKDHPYLREAAAGEPEVGERSARPATIANVDDVDVRAWRHGRVDADRRDLGRAAGSVRTGLKHVAVSPGKWSVVTHCHSAEEEIFVVLEGDGFLELGGEELAVRRGHVVARPPATGVAHTFRAGAPGLTLLAYGTREPNDISYYPRSNKIYFRGVGVIGRVEKLDYWDGEEL